MGEWRRIDVTLALCGILGGLILLALAVFVSSYQYGLAITMLVTGGGYLLMRKSLGRHQQTQVLVDGELHQRVWLVRIVTGCALVLSALVVGVSYNSMGRPYWTIFLLSIIPASVLIQVFLFTKLSRELEVLLLLQIVILLAAITLSGIYAYPYDGGDTVVHIRNARSIVNAGTVDGIEDAYRSYPAYPAVMASLSELMGMDLAQVARMQSLVGALIGLLSLYGLARISCSAGQSLVLALLLVGSQWFVYWTTVQVVSMVTSLWFFCLTTSLVYRRLSGPLRPQASLAIIVFVASVPFFHPLGAAAVVVLFSLSSLLDVIMSGRRDSQWRRSIVGLSVLAAVITITQWVYYGTTFETALRALARTTLGIDELQLSSTSSSAMVYNLDHLNLHLLYLLSGLGILAGLRSRQSRIDIYAGIVGLGFVLIGYVPQALGIEPLLGHRWLLFASLLLVFPASSALFSLIRNRSTALGALLSLGTIAYFVLALGSPTNNRDNPLYGESYVIPFPIAHTDYAGLHYLGSLPKVHVSTDRYLCVYLLRSGEYSLEGRLDCWSQVDFAQIEGLFTFRGAYLNRRTTVGKDLTSEDLSFQQDNDVMLLYDSGDFKVFERVPALSYRSERD